MYFKRIGELEDYERNNICELHKKCKDCPLVISITEECKICIEDLRRRIMYKSELLIGVPDESDKQ